MDLNKLLKKEITKLIEDSYYENHYGNMPKERFNREYESACQNIACFLARKGTGVYGDENYNGHI